LKEQKSNQYQLARRRDPIASIPVSSTSHDVGSGTAPVENVSIAVPMPPLLDVWPKLFLHTA
jgi:hypothetical protein